MENRNLAAFPAIGNEGKGLTKEEWFAAHAPSEIPGWFSPALEELGSRPPFKDGGKDEEGDIIDANRENRQAWERAIKCETYFQWRKYYGVKMSDL
jgi:hypothetical protein